MQKFSVLDLAPIVQGSDAAQSFRNSLDLARHVEEWGFHRYWLAEHHNMPGVASAATSVLVGHIAAGTKSIRVGSGGIMLPNHAPLQIAEQFGTLEALFPGRIDLGLGRAPGGDMGVMRALRRALGSDGSAFPMDVREVQSYFAREVPDQTIKAIPGVGLNVPLYILGSSDFGARLAGELGLPFAFASHFAPDYLLPALSLYRYHFSSSQQLSRPYAMVGVNVIAAETDEEAQRLTTSLQQAFLGILRGRRSQLPPPVESMDDRWSQAEALQVARMMNCSAIGTAQNIEKKLREIIKGTGADELVVTAQIFDHGARVRSFAIAGEVLSRIAQKESPMGMETGSLESAT